MLTLPSRIYFNTQLAVLYKLFHYLGYINFEFNESTRTVTVSKLKAAVSLGVYIANLVLYGSIGGGVLTLFVCILNETNKSQAIFNNTALEVEESLLQMAQTVGLFFASLLIAINYLRYRRLMFPIVHEMVAIFKEIQKLTDAGLYFDSKVAVCLSMKCILVAIQFRQSLYALIMLFLCPVLVNQFFLNTLMFFAHIYSQLVLICFYLKMDDHLGSLDRSVARRHLRKCIAISDCIHRVKWKLNAFFNVIGIVTYMGILNDVRLLYELLKVIIYSKYITDIEGNYVPCILGNFPLCFAYTLDMYLIGLLSDKLGSAKKKFERQIERLLSRKDIPMDCSLKRELEVMSLQSCVYGLDTTMWNKIKLNREFWFDFLINAVLMNVVTFLQFFAGELIYSPNNRDFRIFGHLK